MKLFIYVEGQEEEMFVNRVLGDHLRPFNVIVQKPILAATSFRIGGDEDEAEVTVGGVTNYGAIRQDILDLFANDQIDAADALTALIDLYALLLRNECARFPTPEDINEEKAKSPSHRILAHVPTYRKIDGFRHLQDIGVAELKAHCPRFKSWLERCENHFR